MSRENESVGACAPQAGDGRPDGGTLLSARDLTVCYGSNEALHPTSLDFAAGQVTALIGPSGGGKTTMIRTMLGLIAPGRGRAFLRGRDGREVAMNAALRGCFSYVPQGFAAFRCIEGG